MSQIKEQESKTLALTTLMQIKNAYLSWIGWKRNDFLLSSINSRSL